MIMVFKDHKLWLLRPEPCLCLQHRWASPATQLFQTTKLALFSSQHPRGAMGCARTKAPPFQGLFLTIKPVSKLPLSSHLALIRLNRTTGGRAREISPNKRNKFSNVRRRTPHTTPTVICRGKVVDPTRRKSRGKIYIAGAREQSQPIGW